MVRKCRLFYALVAVIALFLGSPLAQADFDFGDFSGFSINRNDSGSPPAITPNTIQLTNRAGAESRSIFCNTPQSISQFTASFTYRAVGNGIGGSFIVQNSAAGPHATGSLFGFSGISNSAAVTLEIANGSPSHSGVFTGGNFGGGSPEAGAVNLLSGNPINVTITYNGSILHEHLLDTLTSNTYDYSVPIDIPAAVGGSTAYVGLAAATGNPSFNTDADQYFSNFHFSASVPEPSSACIFLGGIGFLLRRRVHRL